MPVRAVRSGTIAPGRRRRTSRQMGRAPSGDCTVFDDRADSAEGWASTANGTNGTRVGRSETKDDWSLAWDFLNGPEHEMVESFRLSRSGDRLVRRVTERFASSRFGLPPPWMRQPPWEVPPTASSPSKPWSVPKRAGTASDQCRGRWRLRAIFSRASRGSSRYR